MPAKDSLYLHEEVMLLALRDEEGTIATGAWYQQAIAGAALAELLLSGRVEAEETKRKLVDLVDSTPFGDPILDECLEKMRTAKRRASLRTWVSRFSSI